MKKIVERWYLSLIIIPIIINLFSGLFNLPELLKNWNFTLILTLIVVCLILIYEMLAVKRENELLKSTPKKSDKLIVKKLLETLDIENFQEKICEQSCWYGYEKDAIRNATDFCYKVNSLKYKTADEDLNKLFQELKQNIEDFNLTASKILYSDKELYYSPDKNTEYNVNRTKEIYLLVDEISKKSLQKLNELLIYLKRRNYFE